MIFKGNKIVSSALVAGLLIVCAIMYYKPIKAVMSDTSTQGEKFSIIMYHNISPKEKLWGKYVLSDKQFEQDLIYIKNKGYNTITMTQLIDHVINGAELPEKPIIITFDDGYESFYAYVYPLLKKYEMSAVLSVVGNFTDLYSKTEDHNLDYSHLTWTEINELSKSEYVEIQNHTYNMHKISKLRRGCGKMQGESFEQYKKELTEDVSKLQDEILMYTGYKSNTFTYPFGHISKESIGILKEMGFQAALTCTEQPNIIKYDSTDWLFNLGRYNRASGKTSEQFLGPILEN